MKAVQVSKASGSFEVVEKPIPQPGENEAVIKVLACGICHSDAFVKEGLWPGIEYPRVPGHEVIGVVEATGNQVTNFSKGQRVGVGWHGGHCFTCKPCRRGDFISCENASVCGISYDGGYQEYMAAPQEALASVPDDLDSSEAAPLLCAGITTFNSLRNMNVPAGSIVAVQGIGGLGHLAIQFANKLGYKVVALSGSDAKKQLALDLGAHEYIDSSSVDPAQALQDMGGAAVIMATAPSSKVISSVIGGLAIDGKVLVLAASGDAIEVGPLQLIPGRRAVMGWPSGTAYDSEDTLNFSALTGVKAMVETYPLEKAEEAYQHMISNQARFRVVLVP